MHPQTLRRSPGRRRSAPAHPSSPLVLPLAASAGSTAVDAMSLTTDKVRREAEKREFSHSSPPPTDDHGRIAKKGAFQGTTMPEGTRCVDANVCAIAANLSHARVADLLILPV